jgi:hypothetical protein
VEYHSSLGFSAIIVIESLSRENLRTGTDVFETTIAPAALAHGVLAELHQPNTTREFIRVLQHARWLARKGHSPILHFEAHGDEEGLQLASREVIAWKELAPLLTEINIAAKMNLLVVAAACHGWFLGSVLEPIDRAPLWAVIGPPESQRAGDLYCAMKRFYSRLLTDFDLVAAIREMNGNRDVDEWEYAIYSAELLFCNVFRYYIRDLAGAETLEQRLNRLVAHVARRQHLDLRQTMMLRDLYRAKLTDHKFWFDRYRKTFLMLDLFPQNAARFQFTFEECLNALGSGA